MTKPRRNPRRHVSVDTHRSELDKLEQYGVLSPSAAMTSDSRRRPRRRQRHHRLAVVHRNHLAQASQCNVPLLLKISDPRHV
jgi:hypothetical protein